MSIERRIVQRLFESKKLYESEFTAGGHHYYCAFGKYYKDGKEISREEYFKAKETSDSPDTTLKNFTKHGENGYSKNGATQADASAVSQGLQDRGYTLEDYDDEDGELWVYSDTSGNKVEVTLSGDYMEVNQFPSKSEAPTSQSSQRVSDYGIDFDSESEYIRDYAYYKSELEAGDDWQAPYSLKYFEKAAKVLNCSPEELKEVGDVDSMEKELYDEEDDVEFDYDKLLSQVDNTVKPEVIDMGGVSATVNTMKDGSKIVVVGEEGLAYVKAK